MLVSTIIGMAQRACGILGVGQTALPQDLSDAQAMLTLLMQQWRQKRWLVFRLDDQTFPTPSGKATYTVGPANPPGITPAPAPPDVVVAGNYRPASVQSIYLRQSLGSGGPNSFPVDFPMRILLSRQEFDGIRLKTLGSWPSLIFYDPTVPYGTLYIWPIPIQPLFSLHIGFQQAIDMAAEGAQSVDFDSILPAESQRAIMWNLALELAVAYKLPPDQQLAAAARASLNTLRQVNFALQPLQMPAGVRRQVRLTNPMGGFYPETSAGIPFSVLT
jgi:hypothetical protein